MKFSLFNPWPVYGVDDDGQWPVPPARSQVEDTLLGMQRGLDISRIADEAGFDYVTLAEHHYHPRQLSPNPLLSAAAVAQHLKQAGISILGATLPLTNPVRTAEEIAVVDAMTGGRLLVGLFRGTPNEFLTYGTNPAQSREVFEEGVSLVVQAWTQPQPFAWVGRHYDYRVVAVWPRPVSRPHPPILVSGNSPASAAYAARNHFRVGISFAPAPTTAAMVARFVAECAALGYTPEAEHILHRGFCLVAETDHEAETLVERYRFGDMGVVFRAPDDFGVAQALRHSLARGEPTALSGPANAPPIGRPGPGPAGRPHFMGSPATVVAQIRDFATQTGVGHFDLIFTDAALDFGVSCQSAELFGAHVIPQLRSAVAA